ncbi:MAG: recombinase family protein [Firmicutes bacterium]|nr:recombinase family protein [Bacillota bacterium]
MDLYKIRRDLSMGIPLEQMDLRVTCYSRVSTEHLEQKKSLKHQVEHFDKMIKNNPNWTYIKGYVDDGITGTSDVKRDRFMQMIDDAKNGKFDLIITKEISRFSRNTLDSIKYTRELLISGVAVLFVNDNINTALPDSELRLTIMASMAQDEVRRLSERVKFGMNRSIEEGRILGNDLMYGYKKDKLTGNLIIVDSEALIVKRIFSLYVTKNYSLKQIADELNKEKIPTSQGKIWRGSSIGRMLKNKKYMGYYCGKKTEVVDYMTKQVKYFEEKDWIIYKDNIRIPPIITEEMFFKANERMKKRAKPYGTNVKKQHVCHNSYLFSSRLYCSEHNSIFHRRRQVKASNDVSWGCSEFFLKGKERCDTPHIRESELFAIFDDIIKKMSLDLNFVVDLLMELYSSSKRNMGLDERLIELRKQKYKIEVKKDKLLELNIEGNLSNEEFSKRNNDCNSELKEIEKKMTEVEDSKQNFSRIMARTEELKRILTKKIKGSSIRDQIIKLILDKIIVSKIDDDKNNIELKVFLNFTSNTIDKKENIVPIVENFKSFFRRNYEFKRGYNTSGTKRYSVYYKVDTYICL